MLSAFGKAFKTPDLRKKIFFTLAIMALFRFGSVVPTPGVSYKNVQECLSQVQSGGLFGLINLFSGGALLHLSVFALGIMPYITSSIIVQLLTVVIPRFEALKNEGQSGTAKLTAVHTLLNCWSCNLAINWSSSSCSYTWSFDQWMFTCNHSRCIMGTYRHHDLRDDCRYCGNHVAW
jgi:preprotein translocase subunit SecY